ncbi:MAG: hypothetical protein E7354_00265 [Clostridiales bacterium]|nr:hypothetical protein [Clostridiales bacterium]
MSQNFYYEDVKVIKKPLKKRLKSYLIFFVILFILGGVILSAMLISRSVVVSNISSLFVYGGDTIKAETRSMYAVYLGLYADYEEANRVAIGSMVQGAGGYVWKDNAGYYVLGSIYDNIDSAELVVGNLSSSSYEVGLLEVGLSKLQLTFDGIEGKAVSEIGDAMGYFKKCYEKLYSFSISFDKGEMNNLAISSFVSDMRGEVKTYISKLQGLLAMPNAKIQEIQKALIKLDELLDQTIIKAIDNSSTASSLKYAICSAIRIEYEMRQNLV